MRPIIGLHRSMSSARGVVAAGHQRTADAAAEVLAAGGNACDAALAGLACACVAEPVLASLGGGGFLLAAPIDREPVVYDFFVQTPARRRPLADLDFYPIAADFGRVTQEFHIGRGTVAVPGMVAGMFAAHRDLGRMPLRDLVAPALEAARRGVEITGFQAYLHQVVAPTFTATPEIRRVFGSPSRVDSLPCAGERVVQPEFADALEAIAHEGEALFYRGEIAHAIVGEVAIGGQLDADDLAAYRSERRRPLVVDYHRTRVLTNPPPSSGGLLIGFALRLIDALLPGAGEFGSLAHLELLALAMQQTAAARVAAHGCGEGPYADPDTMLDPAFLARYRAEVAGRARASRGTTHVSVIDAAGNLASATVSNGEGCGHVVPGTGIVLNNMLGEEDLNPQGFQRWPMAHRMTSMMAPTALLWPDGRRVATGSGGSNRIRSALLQVLVNLVDYRLPLAAAVEAPRIHFERDLLNAEGGLPAATGALLRERFPNHHFWDGPNMFFGGAHSAERSVSGEFTGVGDPRRGGASRVAGRG